jgi:hypothetical protein
MLMEDRIFWAVAQALTVGLKPLETDVKKGVEGKGLRENGLR